jgi:ATP/maltotriose-dependent transcriptional regulator MalT/DNA-binding SARP family transcriptional activator
MARGVRPTVKVTQPKVAGVLLRDRLFRAIEKCRSERPILWLSGPAGSGKTTLVSSYIQSSKLTCLWYQIDERDRDVASFFSCMGLAVKKARPAIRTPMPVFTPEYQMGIPAFSKGYFEEVYRRLRSPSVLVLDNYQTVPDDSRLHEVMAAGLSVLPGNIGLIIISRSGPHPRLIRFRVNGLMELMGWDQIRFTMEEVEEVVRRQLSARAQDLTDGAVAKLHAKTDGWIAGIILMLQTILASGIEAALDGEDAATGVFDYFANELFEGASDQVRRFLLKSAFLPMFSTDTACKLTGVENAGGILEELSFKHYFTTKHPGKTVTYQYHPLFRDFLRHQAKAFLSADELTLLKKETANLLAAAGQMEDAADLFIEAREWEKLTQSVFSCARLLVEQGRYNILEKWIDALPPDVLENTPWLLYWKGICRVLFNPREGQCCFEQAFKQFEADKDAAGTFLSLCGILESIQYAFEDMHQLDPWIRRLPVLVRELGGFPSEEIETRMAAVVFRALVFRQPLHPDFDSWLKRALLDRDVNSKIKTLAQLAWHYASRGYMVESHLVMNDLRQLAATANASPLGLIWMKVVDHTLQDLSGYHVKAAQEGLQIAEKSGVHIADFLLLGNDAVVAFNRGDLASARLSIRKMTSLYESLRPWDRGFYDFLLGYEAFCSGDLKKARMQAELAVQSDDAVGVRVSSIWGRYLSVVVLHELGEHEKADELLEEAHSIGGEIGSILSRYEYCLFKAQFSMDQGRKKEVLSYLQEAMAIGKQQGIFGVYALLPPSSMARLAVLALENRIEVDYAQELIRRRRLVPAEPPVEVEAWPWPLKVYVLGDFRIEKDGKPLVFSGKLQRKPLAVLKAIIAFGEKSVTEEQIKDLLWPDAEGDAAHSAFKMAVSRLRGLIGNGDAVRSQEGRMMLDPRLCWVDAWAFERMADEAENRLAGQDLQSVEPMEKVLALYKGEFLPADTGHGWTVSVRERLRSRHFRVACALARYWEKSGDDEKAAAFYERTLAADSLVEDFYRHLMACYQRLGRQAAAVETYHRCRKMLAAGLGIAPSPSTEALYHALIGKEIS